MARAGGIATGWIGTEARRELELALGDRPYIDDLRIPGDYWTSSFDLAADGRADAASAAAAARVGIIHTDWPVFIPEGGRTSYLGDVLADRGRRLP